MIIVPYLIYVLLKQIQVWVPEFCSLELLTLPERPYQTRPP